MAYAHGITREDVFTAASEIFATGKNPTQASVRSKLGKGSFSTISKYLAEWKEQQTDAESVSVADDEIPDEIRSILKRFYAVTKTQVESSVVGDQVSILEKENEELHQRVVDYEATKSELIGLRFAYQEAVARLETLIRENERLVKYSVQVDQIELITNERDQLLKQVSLLTKVDEKLDTKISHLEDQINAVVCDKDTAIKRANEMSDQLLSLTTANQKMNQQLSDVAERNIQLLDQQKHFEVALGEKLAEIEELKNELSLAKASPIEPTKTKRTRKPKAEVKKSDDSWQSRVDNFLEGDA